MSLLVVGEALGEVLGEEIAALVGGHSLQHRTYLVRGDYAMLDVFDRHGEMDDGAVIEHESNVLVAASCTATGGDNSTFHISSREKNLAFDETECLFAIPFEEKRYGGAEFVFDGAVGVENVVAEEGCELPTEGAFAAVAISYEVNQV